MITYRRQILSNGLTVVVNRDRTSKLAAVNLLYKVGARNEHPERTGFAHLFEHLMFRGTRCIPDFDRPVQMASGDNNAFTNNDYTDYYITLPAVNIETALWLESDRMTGLDITARKLSLEKRVVVEEFRQRYLNQPYGDQTMLLRALAYRRHPYRWATIGLTPEHIERATLGDVEAFYRRWYRPSNAILSLSGDLPEERMIELAETWFGQLPNPASDTGGTTGTDSQTAAAPAGRSSAEDPENDDASVGIPATDTTEMTPRIATAGNTRENPAVGMSGAPTALSAASDRLPDEPEQREARRMEVVRDVPATALSIAFHIGGRRSQSFFEGDLVSDLLAGGDSGRLYRRLVQERRLFASVNAYVTGDVDPGLFVLTGQLLPSTTPEQAEAAFWEELDRLKTQPVDARETEKVKNKFEANTLFGELNVMNKALNLGFYEMLGDLSLIDRETGIYRSIDADAIRSFSRTVFRTENSSTLLYKSNR